MEKYICLVDSYRRPSRKRNTAGRYIVCAKNKKEAKELLQKAIGFGSVSVYYEVSSEGFRQEKDLVMNRRDMYKCNAISSNSNDYLQFEFVPVEHALSPKK